MATADTSIHSRGARLWTSGLKAGAAAVLVLVITAFGFAVFGGGTTVNEPARVVNTPVSSGQELMRDLVNRGLIPEQALHPAPRSQEEVMRDLVNRGLIPKQSLETARSREAITCDLVNRGLVPREALNDRSVCATLNR